MKTYLNWSNLMDAVERLELSVDGLTAKNAELLRQNRELRRALQAVVDSDSDVLLRGAVADAGDTLETCKEL